LKHIWDQSRIPSSHDPALEGYITGLQSQGPRQRLYDQARQDLKDLKSELRDWIKAQEAADGSPSHASASLKNIDMEDPAARKAAYEAALQREIENLTRNGLLTNEAGEKAEREWKLKQAKDERSERLLHALLASDTGHQLDSNGLLKRGKDGQFLRVGAEEKREDVAARAKGGVSGDGFNEAVKRKRKSKARTQVGSDDEDDSSSESSESESESDSSSDDDSDSDSDGGDTSSEEDTSEDESGSDSDSADEAETTDATTAKKKPAANEGQEEGKVFDKEFLDKCFGPKR